MKQHLHLIPCAMLLAGFTLLVSSCNTFIGFGRDIESLGSGMQNKAYGRDWSGEDRSDVQPAPAPPTNPY